MVVALGYGKQLDILISHSIKVSSLISSYVERFTEHMLAINIEFRSLRISELSCAHYN